jgi:hypothetical protein
MTDRSDAKSGVGTDRGPRLRIQEGYVKKGGQNTSYQITTRPGSPAPMKPTSQGDASSRSATTPKLNPSATQDK